MADDAGSVTELLQRIEDGKAGTAEDDLFQRYQSMVLQQAHRWTGDMPVCDEEDVAASVWQSFFSGARRGVFPACKDRHDFRRLLAKITFRKAVNLRAWLYAAKRHPNEKLSNRDIIKRYRLNKPHRRVAELYLCDGRSEDEIASQLGMSPEEVRARINYVRNWLQSRRYKGTAIFGGGAVDSVAWDQPGPLEQLIIGEAFSRLPTKYRQVIDLLLQGNKISQIATALDVCEETVRRRLRYVRRFWEKEF